MVLPEYQGDGAATAALDEIIKLAADQTKKAVRLDALASNTPAHRLYEALGFQKRDQRWWYAANVGWTDFFLYELVL